MNEIILKEIPFKLDREKLIKYLHIEYESEDSRRMDYILSQVQDIAKPKGIYKEAFIDEKGKNYIIIDDVKLCSQILRVNLEGIFKVFPFAVTCGKEVNEWSFGFDDFLEKYWVDFIKEQIVRCASTFLKNHIKDTYKIEKLSCMNPGSLENWPITEQLPLFKVLGDVYGTIGVNLTDSFLMVPSKSVSGIYFPTEINYENCQLCQRDNCKGRHAMFDKALYQTKYFGK